VEELQGDTDIHGQQNDACYYFFKYDNPVNSNPAAAYRSILAQILQLHRHDQDLIDKFAFAMSISVAN